MDLHLIKYHSFFFSLVVFLFVLFIPKPSYGAYGLCGGPCNPWGCNAPYVCDPTTNACLNACSAQICGEYRQCGRYCTCTSILPLKPTNLRKTNTLSVDLPISVSLAWDFNSGAQNCGRTDGWGMYCSSAGGGAVNPVAVNNNSFRIYNASWQPLTGNLVSTQRIVTIALTSWTDQVLRVCASNNGFITSNCSTPLSFTPASPTPYPTIVITGSLKQKSENSNVCYDADAQKYFKLSKIAVVPASPNCITPVCTGKVTNDQAYGFSCNVKFDNIQCQLDNNNLRPTPSQNFGLDAAAQDYDSAGLWVDPASTTCDAGSLQLAVNAINPVPIQKSISFNYNSRWIKVRDSSYYSPASTAQINYVPAIPQAFDSEDTGTLNFIIQSNVNAAGAALGLNIGSYGKYSSNEWGSATYIPSAQKFKTNSIFLDYLKSKKEYKTIASLSELSAGINLIDNDVEINDTNKDYFNNYNSILFLLNDHTLTFNLTSFEPSKSTMFVSGNISIGAAVEKIGSAVNPNILVADNISVADASGKGLKIYGNLISHTPINNLRDIADNAKPSIFIFFKVKPYLDLLPYLSSSIYDWKQTQ